MPQVSVVSKLTDQLIGVNRVLNRAHQQGGSASRTDFGNRFLELVNIVHAVERVLIELGLIRSHFVVLAAGDPLQVLKGLGLGHEGVHEVAALDQGKVVAESRLDNETVAVLESAFAVHHAVLPVADVDVARLALSALGPHEEAETILDAVQETAPVLGPVFVDQVALTRHLIVVPVTRVPASAVTINLNAEPVADGLQMLLQIVLNSVNVLNDEHIVGPG